MIRSYEANLVEEDEDETPPASVGRTDLCPDCGGKISKLDMGVLELQSCVSCDWQNKIRRSKS